MVFIRFLERHWNVQMSRYTTAHTMILKYQYVVLILLKWTIMSWNISEQEKTHICPLSLTLRQLQEEGLKRSGCLVSLSKFKRSELNLWKCQVSEWAGKLSYIWRQRRYRFTALLYHRLRIDVWGSARHTPIHVEAVRPLSRGPSPAGR